MAAEEVVAKATSLDEARRARRRTGGSREIHVYDDAPPCVPDVDADGNPIVYVAVATGVRTFVLYGIPKIGVMFDVAIPGDDDSEPYRAKLEAYYALGKNGRPGRQSEYVRAWMAATGRKPTRRDRLTPSVFLNGAFEVTTKIVRTDGEHQPLPEAARYSRVHRIVRRLAGRP